MEKEKLDRQIPDILYHYCSVNSFYEIIRNGEIWLTSSRYFNDYGEVEHFKNLTIDYLEKSTVSDVFKEAFLTKFNSTVLEYYVLCFSEESNSLSQWRGYADDGFGVNIGFKISSIGARNIYDKGLDYKTPFYYGHVIYDSLVARKFIAHYIDQFVGVENPNPKAINFTAYYLLCYAIFYKEEHFSEEKEVRLVYIPNTKIFLEVGPEDMLPDHLQNQKFGNLRKAIVPYRSFCFQNNGFNSGNKFISEIGLGPRCKIRGQDMEQFLIANHITISLPRIVESKITYGG